MCENYLSVGSVCSMSRKRGLMGEHMAEGCWGHGVFLGGGGGCGKRHLGKR